MSLAGPLLSLHWLWLCVAMTAALAACSSKSPVWMGGTEAHGFRADCPVAPPQVTDLISGSLCLVKASTELSKPAKPSAAQAEQPATGRGCRRERPRWPSRHLKRPLRPGQPPVHQVAEGPPADQSLPWVPSRGGPLFAPVRDALVVVKVRHQPA